MSDEFALITHYSLLITIFSPVGVGYASVTSEQREFRRGRLAGALSLRRALPVSR